MNNTRMRVITVVGAILLTIQISRGGPTTEPSAAPAHLAFRLVASDDADADPAKFEMLSDPFTHAMIPVDRQVLLDETDVSKVQLVPSDHVISMKMTPGGAAKLKQITAANIGRRLAIVLDGRIIIAPTIRSAVSKAVAISLGPKQTDDDLRKLTNELEQLVKRGSATTQSSTQP